MTYNFTYDQYGNTSNVTIGDELTVVQYEYNMYNGKLKKVTYAGGYSERYVYDHLDNISEIWYTVGGVETKAYEYKYTQNGQLFSVTDLPNGIVSVYEYDRKGRMIGINVYSTEDYNYDLNTAVSYDRYDRITGYTDTVSMPRAFGTAIQKKVSVSYEYGSNGLLKKSEITGAGGMTHEYRYNKFDQLIKRTETSYGGFYREVEYEYEYTDERQSANRVEWFISSAGTESSHHEKAYWYTYGTDNNITRVFQSGWTVDYQYDDLNQLIREDNLYLNQTYTYTYDTAGNILEKKIYNYTTGALGTPIDTIVYVYGNGDWGDQLTRYDGHIITYDRVGNPLSYNNGSAYTFTWEGRRLKTAVKGTQSFTFSYNDEGIRTSKTVNGVEHNYILSGSRIVAEYWGSNLIVYVYDAEGSPIGMQYLDSSTSSSAWQTFWYEKNLQGDIVTVYSNDGTPLINYFYDAWGNHITRYENSGASTKATLNPFRYRGYYYDEDLGLYYLNSRYYDSTVGRFISSDSMGYLGANGDINSYNLYVYCNNNPINYCDYTGESAAVIGLCIIFGLLLTNLTASDKIILNETEKEVIDQFVNEEVHCKLDENGETIISFELDKYRENVPHYGRDYFYEKVYEKSVFESQNDENNNWRLMDVEHIRWETEWHNFAGYLGFSNADLIELNTDETIKSMIKKGWKYVLQKMQLFFQ